MVLTTSLLRSASSPARRRFAISRPALTALALVLGASAAGCKEQSLFDEGKDEQEGPGPVGAECPADCLGDAARDFAESDGAAGERWRYLEDRRDRTWTELSAAGGVATGADPALTITTCGAKPTSVACAQIPGALLVSSSGASTASDPALEFKVASKGTLQVGVRAFVPDTSPAQQILIYRNSREDLLFAGPATPGTLFEQAVAVDALSGDRLLVALAPASGGATDVALELFVSDTGLTSRCQVALTFEQVSGNAVNAQCGGEFTSYDYDGGNEESVPVLGAGPFPEHGQAVAIPKGSYLKGANVFEKTGDVTIQYWMKVNSYDETYALWPFSDLDLTDGDGGGIGTQLFRDGDGTIRLRTSVCTFGGPPVSEYAERDAPLPDPMAWKFVRMVYTGGKVSTCVDGKLLHTFDLPPDELSATKVPYLGRNVTWSPQVAVFDGSIDDFRALSTALPCQ